MNCPVCHSEMVMDYKIKVENYLLFLTRRNVGVQFDLAAGRTECCFYFFLVASLFDRDRVKEQTVFDLDLVIQNHFSMTNWTVHKTPTS